MPALKEKVIAYKQQPKMVSCLGEVFAGPERAAELGVPVGTLIHAQEVRLYKNPLRQLWWRLHNRSAGRIKINRGA